MKILIKQFLGKNHSWSVVGWGIAQALIDAGHKIDLFSTDGIKHLPTNLKNNLIGYVEENNNSVVFGKIPDKDYDCQISYTCMINFQHYLSNGSKNRFGIWCYEWAGKNVLPNGFAKNYKYCDKLLAPSNFAKQVFIDSGVSDNNIYVIPHGISSNYINNSTIKLPTNKKFKILANIAQNHLRKNIPGLLRAYGKAFSKKDDVCLILKSKHKSPNAPFEISLQDCLNNFYKQYPNHAEIKIFSEFVEDISSLYRSIDATFTMANCEGFYFPGLESIASGKLAIAPNWGGQLDFLNNSNSLLIDGKESRANPKSMYWSSSPNAIWFEPSIEDAVDKLKYAYSNYETLNKSIDDNKTSIYNEYNWGTISNKIIDLCQ